MPGYELVKGDEMKLFRRKHNTVMENRFKPKVEVRTEKPRRENGQADSEPIYSFTGNEKKGEKGSAKALRPLAALGSFLDGSVLTNRLVVRNIPYLLFITALAVLYITNSASAEKNRRESAKVVDELKELRYKYISTKSSVMFLSNQSQISLKLGESGIRENVVPPVKIFVTEQDQNP